MTCLLTLEHGYTGARTQLDLFVPRTWIAAVLQVPLHTCELPLSGLLTFSNQCCHLLGLYVEELPIFPLSRVGNTVT